MWHTSRGDRTLQGEEAALLRTAVDSMIDALSVHVDDEFEDVPVDCESGIAIFDALTPAQRIALLHDVAKHLLTDTPTTMPLSAASEATVAAIFADIRDQIAIEIDFLAPQSGQSQPTWRQMVLAASQSIQSLNDGEGGGPVSEREPREDVPAVDGTDIHQWEALIDELTDAILWDRDFEMAESFLDVDPGVSHQRRRLLGIDADYFTSVAPDPRPDEVFELISKTRDIVRAKPR